MRFGNRSSSSDEKMRLQDDRRRSERKLLRPRVLDTALPALHSLARAFEVIRGELGNLKQTFATTRLRQVPFRWILLR